MAKVGKVEVKLKNCEHYSIVSFVSGEHGAKESGDYAFWTAHLTKKIKGSSVVICRARINLPPEERFNRMFNEITSASSESDREAYKYIFEVLLGSGNNIKFISPSSKDEINRWLYKHQDDAPYAEYCMLDGKAETVRYYKMI